MLPLVLAAQHHTSGTITWHLASTAVLIVLLTCRRGNRVDAAAAQ